jgi:alkylphosphonate utilization operon protein PhnA
MKSYIGLKWERKVTPLAERPLTAMAQPWPTGDNVHIIKDLDVKGTTFTAKRGTLVKAIRLGEDPELVEGKVNGTSIMLKTCFLKKV